MLENKNGVQLYLCLQMWHFIYKKNEDEIVQGILEG